MRWKHWPFIVPLRLRSVFRNRRVEADLEDELQFHLEQKTNDGIAHGLTPDAAHLEALRAMDGLEQRKEEMRDMRHIHWLSDFTQDLRYAIRSLGHARAFTALVVFTLAIGIGINSAIFSLADAVLLRPLPVLHPSEVVTIGASSPNQSFGSLSYLDYVAYRDQAKSFKGLVAFTQMTGFGFKSEPHELPRVTGGMGVSGNFFEVLGVTPELGRGFRPDEDSVVGRDAVVILGNDFWREHFGADPSVLGRPVQVNGVEFTIVGVAPARFTGMDLYNQPAIFLPLHMVPRLSTGPGKNLLEDRDDRELITKGRLKAGVSTAQAAAELMVIGRHLAAAFPETNRNLVPQVKTELELRFSQSQTDASLATMLLLLAGAVLLVACSNVASLLLSRSRMRAREIAVRLAIGAGRFRLVRLLLTESLLLALLGGGAGLAFGYAGIRFFARYKLPTDLPVIFTVRMDQRVLLFSFAISILSAIFFGLAPAVQTTRANLVTALKTADVELPAQKRLWGRSALVIMQVAASMVLLIVSASTIRDFRTKWNSGPGFRTTHILTMAFDPHLVGLNPLQTRQFYQDLVKRARAVPGVTSAALTEQLPMANASDGVAVVPEGFQMPPGKESFGVEMNIADEDYFHTLDVQMVRGRVFRATDTPDSPRVAVVNEEFARHYYSNRDALGKRFRLNDAKGPLVEIVGISRTAKYNFIAEPPTEFIYLPLAQQPHTQMTLLAATGASSDSLAAPLREMVRGLDSRQPVFDVRTIEEFYQARVVGAPQMILQTVTAMGIVGLILAIAGLYGLVAYAVSRRTREIGIRMAIGADRRSVLRMVMRQGLALTLAGIAIGSVLGLFAQRGMDSVFGDSGADVSAFIVAISAMLIVTILAAYVPARRASRIEPMSALRYE